MSGDFTFADAVRAYQAAAWPVLADPAVWQEEAQRDEPRLMAWPFPAQGTKFARLLAALANADIDVLLVILHAEEDPRSPTWPPSVHDPKLQVLLRVAHRSLQAGESAIIKTVGPGRITGRRDYINRVHEQSVELALRLARKHQLTRDEAFDLLALPRRQAFRAAKRATKRR